MPKPNGNQDKAAMNPLRQYRQGRYSIRQIASILQVSPASVVHWEYGTRLPSISSWKNIINTLADCNFTADDWKRWFIG